MRNPNLIIDSISYILNFMPPKQQPEEVNSGYKPYFVLPIVLDSENA